MQAILNYNFDNPLINILILIWVLPWKGVALWKAAKRSDKIWYAVLLVFQTLGILEILYIFIWSRRPAKKENKSE